MKKKIIFAIMGCVTAGTVLLSACSKGGAVTVPDTITVKNADDGKNKVTLNTAETVKVVPDMSEIVFGIRTEAAEADQCQADNAENLERLLEYLKAQGVEEKSIATSGFSLDPRYDWSGNKQTLIGYEMRTQVTVTNIPMDQTGAMLTKGVKEGANEIVSVNYFSSSYDEAYAEALKKAVELARSKAEALAAASGQKAGDVLSIQEYNDSQYGRYVSSNLAVNTRASGAMKEEAAMDMGVMPGEMSVKASICVEIELLPAE